jgi:hypothetical protein
MDAFGEVTTAGTWIELISEPQKYYRVVKFTEE